MVKPMEKDSAVTGSLLGKLIFISTSPSSSGAKDKIKPYRGRWSSQSEEIYSS